MTLLKNFCKSISVNRGPLATDKNLKKYFTVVQYDDGCLANVENCRVFGSGGVGDDPIPLITDRHKLKGLKKIYFTSFLGSVATHPIRKMMMEIFKDEDMFFVEDVYTKKENIPRFAEITEQSCFTLCPRGYGKTSFRLYEAMQLGSVPVYISDVPWVPFTQFVDWNKFCVIIKPEDMKSLPELLKKLFYSGEYKVMAENAKKAYDEYFCYESTLKWILELLLMEEKNDNDKRKT
jgi:hypothetical protein